MNVASSCPAMASWFIVRCMPTRSFRTPLCMPHHPKATLLDGRRSERTGCGTTAPPSTRATASPRPGCPSVRVASDASLGRPHKELGHACFYYHPLLPLLLPHDVFNVVMVQIAIFACAAIQLDRAVHVRSTHARTPLPLCGPHTRTHPYLGVVGTLTLRCR